MLSNMGHSLGPVNHLVLLIILCHLCGMELEKKDQRVPVMMTAAELAAVDDWRFQNRVSSRGEAIRQLIAAGLIAQKT